MDEERPSSIWHTVGKGAGVAFREFPVVMLAGSAIALFFALTSCEDTDGKKLSTAERAQLHAQLTAQKEAIELAKIKRDCDHWLPNILATYEEHAKANRHADAASAVQECSHVNDDLRRRFKTSDIAAKSATAANRKAPSHERVIAVQALRDLYPSEANPHLKDLPALKAIAGAEERRRDAAERKKKGITIGMSTADVRASSWGEPERINSTINAYSTTEQWVYGNGNYLYFDNGVLRSMQLRER